MPKVDVYDLNGKKVSDIELAENVFKRSYTKSKINCKS